MSTHPAKIRVVATNETINAELHDSLSLGELLDAQALWAPGKIGIAKECLRLNLDRSLWPQSLHWNWADKASALQPYAPGPLSSFRLFGMSAEGKWQAVLLACCVGLAAAIMSLVLKLAAEVSVDAVELLLKDKLAASGKWRAKDLRDALAPPGWPPAGRDGV